MDQQNPQNAPTADQSAAANPPVDRAAIEREILQQVFDGKYQSVDDARKGHWELNNYAAQAYSLLADRNTPAETAANRQSAYDRLAKESLVEPNLLREAVREEAGALIEGYMRPFQAAAAARQELAVTAPDYIQNETAIMGWLQSNPQAARDVARLNSANLYDLAAKTALTYWRAANPPASAGNSEAKLQAQLPNAQLQNSRGVEQENFQNIRQQAIAYGHRTGDRRAAYSSVFPDFQVQLPPHIAAELQR